MTRVELRHTSSVAEREDSLVVEATDVGRLPEASRRLAHLDTRLIAQHVIEPTRLRAVEIIAINHRHLARHPERVALRVRCRHRDALGVGRQLQLHVEVQRRSRGDLHGLSPTPEAVDIDHHEVRAWTDLFEASQALLVGRT